MSRGQGWVAIALLITLNGLVLLDLFSSAVAQPQETHSAVQPWEYQVVFVRDSGVSTELAMIGREGWEVVSSRRANDGNDVWGYELILRRPK